MGSPALSPKMASKGGVLSGQFYPLKKPGCAATYPQANESIADKAPRLIPGCPLRGEKGF